MNGCPDAGELGSQVHYPGPVNLVTPDGIVLPDWVYAALADTR